ncbi:MAG: VWA domain-containing protein [Calditrichae bacterium]|nr:VWA domain-containing protein [Calditrichia bacterium]
MHRIRFRAEGWTETEVRRWKRRFQSPLKNPWLAGIAIVGILIYSVRIGKIVDSAPVSGVLPGSFTATTGAFQLSISPLDPMGNLLTSNISTQNFSISSFKITPPQNPEKVLTSGAVSIDSLQILSPSAAERGLDAVLLFDNSGSMEDNDSTRQRVKAGKRFIDRIGENDSAAVMIFSGDQIATLQTFTNDKALLDSAMEQLGAKGASPLYAALYDAIENLSSSRSNHPCIIVLTDGESSEDSRTLQEVVNRAQSSTIPIFPIGLGEHLGFSQLRELALKTGGTFASAENSQRLNALFDHIAVSVTRGRIILHAQSIFEQKLTPGEVKAYGEITTNTRGHSVTTPFDFRAEVSRE